MTRAELDAALARLGLAVPEGERDQIVAAAHPIEKVGADLRSAMPFLDPVKVVDGAVQKA